jgi:hypothetical protein
MDDKIGLLKQAILFQREVTFDYVSKNLSVKFGRHILPGEIKDNVVSGIDLEDDNKLKRFLIDGIQKLQIILPYEQNKETADSGDSQDAEGTKGV